MYVCMYVCIQIYLFHSERSRKGGYVVFLVPLNIRQVLRNSFQFTVRPSTCRHANTYIHTYIHTYIPKLLKQRKFCHTIHFHKYIHIS